MSFTSRLSPTTPFVNNVWIGSMLVALAGARIFVWRMSIAILTYTLATREPLSVKTTPIRNPFVVGNIADVGVVVSKNSEFVFNPVIVVASGVDVNTPPTQLRRTGITVMVGEDVASDEKVDAYIW
jgi:hypothetical protein